MTRDKSAVLAILRKARASGKVGDHVPVVLKHGKATPEPKA